MSDEAPTRRGKIASLPASIREELCRRLHDGQRGPQLLPWLNGLPEVLAVLDEQFGEEPITANNLSDWRKGGYQDFLKKLDRLERTKQLADYCRKVGDAGAGELGLPAALAGGALMAVLEDFDADTLKGLLAEKPEKFLNVISTMAQLETSRAKARVADSGAEAVKQRERALDQRERQIEQAERKLVVTEEAHNRKTCEVFIKWAADEEAKRIATSTASEPVKMKALMERMFGKRPEATPKPFASDGGGATG